jgi:hypothetical protein
MILTALVLLLIVGVALWLVMRLVSSTRDHRTGSSRILLNVAVLALWTATWWVLVGVQFVFERTGACMPPGVSVRYTGDGTDRVDCELPPR